jgi:hypothetical protein
MGLRQSAVVGARVTGVDSMGRVARLSMQSDLAVWTATGTNTSGTWIDLVLEDAGWDTDNDFDSDFTTESLDRMILAATTGDNALSTAQQFVRTEGFARLFASKDDEDIQYQGRYWTVGASSALTFGTGGIPIDSVGMAVSSELLFNQVITKSTNTATVVEDDSTSQGVYGLRSLSRTDLVFDTLAATRAYAEAYLEEFKTPQARLESLTVNLRDLTAAQIDDVLTLEIGDVVTVTFTPRGADEVDLEFVVEGIAHQAYPGPEHGVTFQLSPRPTIETFDLDSDQLGRRQDWILMGSGFRDFATNEVLTSANVNNYLMTQAVMSFASSSTRDSALSGSLEEGMVAYGRSENRLWVYDGSAWQVVWQEWTSYTPTLAGTGWSQGNGVFTAGYAVSSGVCHFHIVLSMGSTTSFGSGAPTFTVPLTADTTFGTGYQWHVGAAQQGAASTMHPVSWRLASSTQIMAHAHTTSGSYVGLSNVTSSVPFTWGTGHRLSARGSYQIA